MLKEIKEYISCNRENIIEDWKDLVNLEGSLREAENMYTVANFVKEKFTQAGVKCEVIGAKPSVPPVVAGVIGRDRKGAPVVFSGHFDTVFDKGTFGDNPFRIEGDKAYGPGVLDMKGGIIIALWVIKALEEVGYNDRPIRICFCGDEEGGTEHHYARDLIKQYTQGCIAGFNMETGPVNNRLCVGRKWAMGADVTIHGVSAHSGNNYEVGRNAIVEAAYKVIALQDMNDMEKGTNMNPAIIQGGVMVNSIPDLCTLKVSGRFALRSEIDRVKSEMERLFQKPDVDGTSIEYKITDAAGGFEASDGNMALWSFVNDVCAKYGMPPVGHVFLGGGSDASAMARTGVPVLCSCGVRGEWNHTDREYALVDSMEERAVMWRAVLLEIGNFKF